MKLPFKIFLLTLFSLTTLYGCVGQGRLSKVTILDSSKVNGDYIGGIYKGKPLFVNQITRKDFIIKDKNTFLHSLKKLKSGQTIFIPKEVVIDLSGEMGILIPEGITLAGDRGNHGSPGGMLFTKTPGTFPLLLMGGRDIKITGLRINGSDTLIYSNGVKFEGSENIRKNTYHVPVTEGIRSSYPNLEISNCEIFGWTHAGISLQPGASNVNIHHNYIHHNRRAGLGYGVVLNGASALIKGNIFDYNRHAVAGTGIPQTSYEAVSNIFLENNDSHVLDMHGGRNRGDGNDIAGTMIKIHQNLFILYPGTKAVIISGIPTEGAFIFENEIQIVFREIDRTKRINRIELEKDLILQWHGKGNMEIFNNTVK